MIQSVVDRVFRRIKDEEKKEMKVNGTVKWFDGKKGYGFITAENKDFFVHFSEIQAEGYKNLVDGEEVEFEAAKDDNGRDKAVSVVRLNPPARKERNKGQ